MSDNPHRKDEGGATVSLSKQQRAVVAAFGWPANQEKDAVYPNTGVDSTWQKLTGANKYTLTFPKDATRSEAGCTPQEIARFTGHSLRDVAAILDKYLARTDKLAHRKTGKG